MSDVCKICNGLGMRVIERPDGSRAATECVCRAEIRATRHLASAKIPKRYEAATLDGFATKFSASDRSIEEALFKVRIFEKAYPFETDGQGLLLIGPNGTGKTTLAISLLKALVGRGFQGLFVTYGELLKQVQNSYNSNVQQTELDVLRPVFDAEILVIDELGSSKPTEWVLDTVAHILNSRYNEQKTTIITTNFSNERELVSEPEGLKEEARQAWRAMYKDNLGDRIGERMRSRLQEMCVVVEMHGVDFRTTVKKARFGHGIEPTPDLKLMPILETVVEEVASETGTVLKPRTRIRIRTTSDEPAGAASPLFPTKEKDEPVVGGARLGKSSNRRDVSGTD